MKRLRAAARRLKADALLLWLAARDPEVPLAAKLFGGAVAAYAFSPVDLIPDFIPILGLLDDLLIVPAGVWLALRMIEPRVRLRLRAEATEMAARPVSRAGLIFVILVWVAVAWLAWIASAPLRSS